MGLATHLGPWLLGTVKNTTGTTAGTLRNTGATPCIQFRTTAATEQTAGTYAFTLPAGSYIQNVQFVTTTAFATTTPTIQLYINNTSTAISAATNLSAFTTTGVVAVPLATSNPSLVANVGTSDVNILFSLANVTGTTSAVGSGVLVIAYLVRNPDGTIYPTYSTGP